MVHFEKLTTGNGRIIALCGTFKEAGKHSTIQGRFQRELGNLNITFKDQKQWNEADFLVAGIGRTNTPAEAQLAGKAVLNESWLMDVKTAKKWVVPTESHKWIPDPTNSAEHESLTDNGDEHTSSQQDGNPQRNEQVSSTSTADKGQGKSSVPTVTGKRKDVHREDNTSSSNVQTNNRHRQSDLSIPDAEANNQANQDSGAPNTQDSGSGSGGAAADTTGKRSSNQTMPDADNDTNDSERDHADNAQSEKPEGTATAQKNAGAASTTGAASVTSGPSAAVPSISLNPSESGVLSTSEVIIQSREGTEEPHTVPQSGTRENESNRTASWVNNAGIHQSGASDTRYSPSPEPQTANQTDADSIPLDSNGEYDQAPLAYHLLSKWRANWLPDCNKITITHPEKQVQCEVVILGLMDEKPSLIAVDVAGPQDACLPITRDAFVLPKSKYAAHYQSYKEQKNKRIIGRGNADKDLKAELAKFVWLGIATQGRVTYCVGIPDGDTKIEPLYFTRTDMKAKYGKSADDHINKIRKALDLSLIGKGANPKKLHPLLKTGK